MRKERKFFTYKRFEKGNIKEGETFSVDSGMGGSFLIEFKGWSGHKLNERGLWKVRNIGFNEINYSFTPEQAAKNIFILS